MNQVNINPNTLIASLREENRILHQEANDRTVRIKELEQLYETSYAECSRVTRQLDEKNGHLSLAQGEVAMLRGQPLKVKAAPQESKLRKLLSNTRDCFKLGLHGIALVALIVFGGAWAGFTMPFRKVGSLAKRAGGAVLRNKALTFGVLSIALTIGANAYLSFIKPYLEAHRQEFMLPDDAELDTPMQHSARQLWNESIEVKRQAIEAASRCAKHFKPRRVS